MPEFPLRMGRISFLNVLPIYHPLETGIIPHNFELVSAPPAILNDMMARGELLISSCSCIEYARHANRYYLVPDLCIGSNGPVMSVLLLAQAPLQKLQGEEILISGQSHTSVALLKLLLHEYYNIKCAFRVGKITPALHSHKPPAAFLAIGDEALRLRNHPAYPWRIDLAEAWREWTGLPFVFGLWVINADLLSLQNNLADPGQLLRSGRDWGLQNMDVILDLTAHGCPLNRQELQAYYEQGLFYSLNSSAMAGLQKFYAMLVNSGLLMEAPPLRFYPENFYHQYGA